MNKEAEPKEGETPDAHEHLDNLRAVQCHLRNLISTIEILIDDEDDKDEVRTLLNAAHRYCDDLFDCAEGIEIGIGVIERGENPQSK